MTSLNIPPPVDGYSPIRGYALVGDCHGSALVSNDGSIDWCCLERFDASPILCRILDQAKGGFWKIAAEGARLRRAYVPGTNILRTTYRTAAGEAAVLDFMPVGRRPGNSVHDYVRLEAPGWLVRIIEGIEGEVDLTVRYRATGPGFGREPPAAIVTPGKVSGKHSPTLYSDLDFLQEQGVAMATVTIAEGERRAMILTPRPLVGEPIEHANRLLEITTAFWEEWSSYCRYRGPHREAVLRSALVLKALTYAPTGALVAAPTTSLPEEIGGERNWDYRFCWLRDASFMLYALAALGYSGEAQCFADFLERLCFREGRAVQIMYGIDGRHELTEEALPHLEGYRGSRPVRVGNGAYHQSQLDIFGEVLDWAALRHALGARSAAGQRRLYAAIADHVAGHWEEPDQGIWEARNEPQHSVYGKMMAWVALDRACSLFGDRDEWREAREKIVKAVTRDGIGRSEGRLKRSFEDGGLDAALLLAPMIGFPVNRRTFEATLEAIGNELRRGDFVYRYCSEDGLAGGEGAFLVCSFWMVDALLAVNRAQEGESLFEQLVGHANDVGLYSEEIDPSTGMFLGNFPQAFTHLALINSAAAVDLRRRKGAAAIRGSHADRARLAIGSTEGLAGLWHAARQGGWQIRLRSSRESIMDLSRLHA